MNLVITLAGLLGIYKFFQDRSWINMLSSINKSVSQIITSNTPNMRPDDRHKLLVSIADGLWEGDSKF